jgi:DNA-binding NtrC family response regulator
MIAYYRLRVFPIHVPPLRERRDDIPELARHFLALAAGGRTVGLSDSTIEELQSRHWTGNIRELRAAMQYAAVVTRAPSVTPDCLPPSRTPEAGVAEDLTNRIRAGLREWAADRVSVPESVRSDEGLHGEFLAQFEGPIIEAALAATGGNRTAAAELLGLHRETLRKKLGGGRG